jgi:hypothetical protein
MEQSRWKILYDIALKTMETYEYKKIHEQLEKNGAKRFKHDHHYTWYNLNPSKGIPDDMVDNVVVDDDGYNPGYDPYTDTNTNIFYFTFYDKKNQTILPEIVYKDCGELIEHLKTWVDIDGAGFWILGPGSIIPKHIDDHPPESWVIPIKAKQFFIKVLDETFYSEEGEPIYFSNKHWHGTTNITNEWWLLLHLHIIKK